MSRVETHPLSPEKVVEGGRETLFNTCARFTFVTVNRRRRRGPQTRRSPFVPPAPRPSPLPLIRSPASGTSWGLARKGQLKVRVSTLKSNTHP